MPLRIGQSGQVRVVDFQFGSGDGGALGAKLFPVAAGVFQEPEARAVAGQAAELPGGEQPFVRHRTLIQAEKDVGRFFRYGIKPVRDLL